MFMDLNVFFVLSLRQTNETIASGLLLFKVRERDLFDRLLTHIHKHTLTLQYPPVPRLRGISWRSMTGHMSYGC